MEYACFTLLNKDVIYGIIVLKYDVYHAFRKEILLKKQSLKKEKNNAVPSVRKLAYDSVYAVKYKGVYSNLYISQSIKKYRLIDRDRVFYTELVYGTLENIKFLDYVIDKFSNVKVDKLSKEVLTILEVSLYQIHYMDGVQNFAVVNEMVNLAKVVWHNARIPSFVNGILRNILRNPNAFDILLPPGKKRLSIEYSVSEWISELLINQYSLEKAEDILYALSQHPAIYLRVNMNKVTTDRLKGKLCSLGVDTEKVVGFDNILQTKHFNGIEKNEYFLKGYFTIQDISSVCCIKALSPKTGEKILDICAAPGGKTTAIAEIIGEKGIVFSNDKGVNKLNLISQSAKRLCLDNIELSDIDACEFQENWKDMFDRVLVDVPCSGLGVIRRKPEIRYKQGVEFKSLYPIQKKILDNASQYVKKDGILIYSTCTLNREENQEVIHHFLSTHTNFTLDDMIIPTLGQVYGMVELLPDEGQWDGFFISKLKRIQ